MNKRIVIEDPRLAQEYSPESLARIAAGCSGDSPSDRIDQAIELLGAAEFLAASDLWTRDGFTGEERQAFLKRKERIELADRCCEQAERNEEGLIFRDSLALLVYEKMEIGKSMESAVHRLRDCLDSMAEIESQAVDLERIRAASENSSVSPAEVIERGMVEPILVTRSDLDSRYFVGKKKVVRSEALGKELASEFAHWLAG